MDSNIEQVEQYLQGVRAPDYVSDSHRQQLRQRILSQIEERQRPSGRHRRMEVTAALAALICIAGGIGAFAVVKYCGAGRSPVTVDRFVGEDHEEVALLRTLDTNDVTSAAQMAASLQDEEAGGTEDDLECVQVIESEVNGRLASRMLIPKRALSSSQMISLSQSDPIVKVQNVLVTLPAAARTEMVQLRQAGKGEKLGTQERQMKGRVFLFKRERYTLHDGTTVTLSVGEPKNTKQPLPSAPAGNQP